MCFVCLLQLQGPHNGCIFSITFLPPRETGFTWSAVSLHFLPHFRQRWLILCAQGCEFRSGPRAAIATDSGIPFVDFGMVCKPAASGSWRKPGCKPGCKPAALEFFPVPGSKPASTSGNCILVHVAYRARPHSLRICGGHSCSGCAWEKTFAVSTVETEL